MGPEVSRARAEEGIPDGSLQPASDKARMRRLLLSGGRGPRYAACAFFAIGVFLLVFHLGRGSLYPWDEALTAVRTLHMYEDGLSLTVRSFGSPDFNKPPLYYWLAAACFHLFGPGLFALRFPGVLFAVGCLVCVYRLTGKATGSAWAACFALACLATNPHWLNIARLGKLEAASAFSLVAALLWGCFGKGRHTPAGGVLTGLLLGIGAWVKHPFYGAVLPLFYCYWKYCDHAAKPLRSLLWSSATFLLAGTGWYVYSLLTWGESFRDFYFVYNVAERVMYGIEGHSEGFFYPIKTAFFYSPAALPAFAASAPAFIAARRKGADSGALAVGLGWLVLLLLCCVTGKREIYTVAWYPLCAVCAGYGAAWAARCVASRPAGALAVAVSRFQDKRLCFAGAVLVCVYNLLFIGVAYRATPDHSPDESGVYRAVKRQAGAHAVVMTNVDTPAVLFFEFGRPADARVSSDNVDAAFMDAAFVRAASGKTVYLVLEESKTAPGRIGALTAEAAARRPEVRVDIAARSGRYRAVRLAPAGDPSSLGR